MEESPNYNLETYDYDIPQERIAQFPLKERDRSRLLILDQDGRIEHRVFSDIINYLYTGDVLVLNDTKVIPARLNGIKEDTGGKVELLLIRDLGDNKWEVMINRRLKPYQMISIGKGDLKGKYIYNNGVKVVKFYGKDVYKRLKEYGLPPLPPYIKRNGSDPESRKVNDSERYQTVYAEKEGSLAAPTAGLHFTEDLLKKLRNIGVEIVRLTLHIGPGTFTPVKVKDIRSHRMDGEFYHIPLETAEIINRARVEGRRIVAVGTTTTRALESSCNREGKVIPGSGYSELFIYPGYRFKVIDALITNFHQPKSTPLMLVSAFTDPYTIKAVYKEAFKRDYRFYSYGDSMLILRRRNV